MVEALRKLIHITTNSREINEFFRLISTCYLHELYTFYSTDCCCFCIINKVSVTNMIFENMITTPNEQLSYFGGYISPPKNWISEISRLWAALEKNIKTRKIICMKCTIHNFHEILNTLHRFGSRVARMAKHCIEEGLLLSEWGLTILIFPISISCVDYESCNRWF